MVSQTVTCDDLIYTWPCCLGSSSIRISLFIKLILYCLLKLWTIVQL